MQDEHGYRDLGEEFLIRARRIADPELRAIYLRLAIAYDTLARFHMQMEAIAFARPPDDDKDENDRSPRSVG
jgi:hypothetical protein